MCHTRCLFVAIIMYFLQSCLKLTKIFLLRLKENLIIIELKVCGQFLFKYNPITEFLLDFYKELNRRQLKNWDIDFINDIFLNPGKQSSACRRKISNKFRDKIWIINCNKWDDKQVSVITLFWRWRSVYEWKKLKPIFYCTEVVNRPTLFKQWGFW